MKVTVVRGEDTDDPSDLVVEAVTPRDKVPYGTMPGCYEAVSGGIVAKESCIHKPHGPLFWTWFRKNHEAERIALKSGLVDQVVVDWRPR